MADILIVEDDQMPDALLPPDHAVPVALMTTELVVNAIKHGEAAPIQVSVGTGSQGRPYVAVANRLSAPSAMDWPSGRGLGTRVSAKRRARTISALKM